MPRIRLLASSLALAICSITAAQAQQFTGVISFGDSLSDAGNIAALQDSQGGHIPDGNSFTTNPDSVAVQLIASAFGFTQTNSLEGGTNYAFGGACVQPGSATFDCVNDPTPGDALSITNQITGYIQGGHVDPDALYTVWGGANDLFTYATLAAGGGGGEGGGDTQAVHTQITGQQALLGVATSAATEVGLIDALQTAGARNILVFNLPNIALTPDAAAQAKAAAQAAAGAVLAGGGTPEQAQAAGQQAAATVVQSLTGLSLMFNTTLNQGMAGRHGIIPVDVFGLVNEVFANHAAYGFTNITDPACGVGATSVWCGPAGDATNAFHYDPATVNSFFFADGVHPTGAGHQLLADYVIAEIQAPSYASMLAETPLQVYETTNRTIHDQMQADMGDGRADGTLRSFAAFDYSRQRFDAEPTSPGMTTKNDSLVLGGDYYVNSAFSFGLATTFSHQKSDFANGGGFQNNEPMGAAWLMWHSPDWYVSLLGAIGQPNYTGIDRVVQLGPVTRVETGSTGGSHVAAEIAGGYWFHFDDMKTGPYVSLTHQRVRVSSYAENGDDSTTMVFDRQNRDSTLTTLGWELTGDSKAFGGTFHPFARVAYVHESDSDPRLVSAGLVGLNGTFSMPGFQPDSSYWTGQLGVSASLGGNFSGFAAYSGHFGDSNQRVDSFNLGLKWSW